MEVILISTTILMLVLIVLCVWIYVAIGNVSDKLRENTNLICNKLRRLEEDISEVDEMQINMRAYLSDLIQKL